MRLVVQPVENKTTIIDFLMFVHSAKVHTTCPIQETVHISTNAVKNDRFVVLMLRGVLAFVLSLWIQMLPEKGLLMTYITLYNII